MIEERVQEREIGGVNYKSQPVAFGEGVKALLRLTKILTPILAAAVRETGVMRIAGAAEALALALSDADVLYFRTLFGTASWRFEPPGDAGGDGKWVPLIVNSKIDNQELHFAGRYLEFIRWLIFNVEVNYGGFFDGTPNEAIDLDKLIAMIKGKMASPAQTSPTGSAST